MSPPNPSRPLLLPADKAAGQRVLLWCLLPFAGPVVLSMALVLTTRWQPLQGLSSTPDKRSREPYHWAHLPGDAAAGLGD